MIVIKAKKDNTGQMVKTIAKEINKSLSEIVPPFNHEKDVIRLQDYHYEAEGIRLTYEVLRNARLSKAEQNLSPYREKGIAMQVGRNS
ncbi:MAG: hypothetical protein JRL30_14070 [Deltaproteobacteria bacterium]|nr:hypothetical protein [Deltaproteobacteria bacterium]